jgi:epoxyqueuosine reductase
VHASAPSSKSSSGPISEPASALTAAQVKQLAQKCGFELAGVAAALPLESDFGLYQQWAQQGFAGEMAYLTDRRAEVRRDPRSLLASARSIIAVGKLYHQEAAGDPAFAENGGDGIISQYAWGRDYHDVLREGLERLVGELSAHGPFDCPFEWKICVDTAPLLERSYARQAGLGWIGKNTCLIHEGAAGEMQGSWFFLGFLLTSLDLEADVPPPDRCGTCTSCIDACPTQAIVPVAHTDAVAGESRTDAWAVDSRLCISYLNIELRGPIPEERREGLGNRIFGCDICQDVCPWNRRAPVTRDADFRPMIDANPKLEELAALTPEGFRDRYRNSPVARTKYQGFLRNVATAMGALRQERFREPLHKLAAHESPLVAEHARWALDQLGDTGTGSTHGEWPGETNRAANGSFERQRQ